MLDSIRNNRMSIVKEMFAISSKTFQLMTEMFEQACIFGSIKTAKFLVNSVKMPITVDIFRTATKYRRIGILRLCCGTCNKDTLSVVINNAVHDRYLDSAIVMLSSGAFPCNTNPNIMLYYGSINKNTTLMLLKYGYFDIKNAFNLFCVADFVKHPKQYKSIFKYIKSSIDLEYFTEYIGYVEYSNIYKMQHVHILLDMYYLLGTSAKALLTKFVMKYPFVLDHVCAQYDSSFIEILSRNELLVCLDAVSDTIKMKVLNALLKFCPGAATDSRVIDYMKMINYSPAYVAHSHKAHSHNALCDVVVCFA